MDGRLVGHYRIIEKIGVGAMGEVFRAHDERLDRDVAVKFVRSTSSSNPDHLRRFEKEAKAAAALNHPNIVAIHDVCLDPPMPYIVSELLEGQNLRQRLAHGPIPVSEAVDYLVQISDGLIAAHERHIVHRDLKPENLFLTKDGRIKILDFGVAKLQPRADDERPIEALTTVTKNGAIVGTVAYMAPEQLRGKPVDHRSDLFSLGVIFYEMLSGCRAFRGETEVDTMTAVLREEPPAQPLEAAAVPLAFQDVVRHCVEKEPENRFQSARDLKFTVQTISPSDSSSTRGVRFARVSRAGARVAWSIAAALALSTAILLWLVTRPPAPARTYERITSEAGTIFAARFAADGQSILYSAAWNGNPVRLFTTVGNSLLTQPLNLSNAGLLGVSHANQLALVLGGTHNGQLETVGGTLATAPIAGGSPHEMLSQVRWADWSPQGDLAVVHYLGTHIRLEYPPGNVLYETTGWISHIRFSPEGNRIAFLDHQALWDDKGSVCIIDLQGHVQRLTAEWEYTDGLAWRPDGKEIWFTAAEKGNNANLFAVTLQRKLRTLLDLPDGISLQDIAPDGRVLIALHSKRLAMAAGTPGTNKEDVDLSWHDWTIVHDISTDGKLVLFEDASYDAGAQYVVAIRRLDSSLPTPLGEGTGGGLSPDGKWAISFTNSPKRIVLLPTGPWQSRTLSREGLEHVHSGWGRFLPNGEAITVNGNEDNRLIRCYLVDLAGNKPRPITPEDTSCGPSSPDGQFVAGRNADGTIGLYPLSGGSPRLIPGLAPGFVPIQWSQDGSVLYGERDELPARIYKVTIATGKTTVWQELHPSVTAGVVNVSPIVVSRDGAHFAYSYNQTLSVLYLVKGLR